MRILTPSDFSLARSIPVISTALKLIVKVTGDAGDPLVYPPESGKTGRIKDWSGVEVGEEGVVFFNGKDLSYQAVASDGNGVIIINEVTIEQYYRLSDYARQIGSNTQAWGTTQVKLFKDYAAALGCVDMYNSGLTYIRDSMVKVGSPGEETEAIGLYRRSSSVQCMAMFIEGPAQFQGPAASHQMVPSAGAVLVKQNENIRVVQTEIFLRTYKNLDGCDITLSTLKNVLQGLFQTPLSTMVFRGRSLPKNAYTESLVSTASSNGNPAGRCARSSRDVYSAHAATVSDWLRGSLAINQQDGEYAMWIPTT